MLPQPLSSSLLLCSVSSSVSRPNRGRFFFFLRLRSRVPLSSFSASSSTSTGLQIDTASRTRYRPAAYPVRLRSFPPSSPVYSCPDDPLLSLGSIEVNHEVRGQRRHRRPCHQPLRHLPRRIGFVLGLPGPHSAGAAFLSGSVNVWASRPRRTTGAGERAVKALSPSCSRRRLPPLPPAGSCLPSFTFLASKRQPPALCFPSAKDICGVTFGVNSGGCFPSRRHLLRRDGLLLPRIAPATPGLCQGGATEDDHDGASSLVLELLRSPASHFVLRCLGSTISVRRRPEPLFRGFCQPDAAGPPRWLRHWNRELLFLLSTVLCREEEDGALSPPSQSRTSKPVCPVCCQPVHAEHRCLSFGPAHLGVKPPKALWPCQDSNGQFSSGLAHALSLNQTNNLRGAQALQVPLETMIY